MQPENIPYNKNRIRISAAVAVLILALGVGVKEKDALMRVFTIPSYVAGNNTPPNTERPLLEGEIVENGEGLPPIQDPNFSVTPGTITPAQQEFFKKFLAEQSTQVRTATMQDLVKNVDIKKFTPQGTLADLTVSSDNSTAALRTYGNAFGVLISVYTKKTHRTEDEILADAMSTKSAQTLHELSGPITSYQNFSSNLKAVSVPSSLSSAHLLIVNGYERMALGLTGMEQLYTDPVTGAAGYEAYTKGKVEVTQGYAQVVAVIKSSGLVFGDTQPGAPFNFHGTASTTTTATTTP